MDHKISIIVPVYNVEKYLKRCINSILNQTFKNFELILVNDGSTDNSLNICKNYKEKDGRIQLISQTNKGLSAARNTGLKYAKGKYVCFVDSDDFIEKEYLSLLLSNIEKYNSDIAMCEYYLTNEEGRKYSISRLNEPKDIHVLLGEKTFSYFYKEDCVPNVVAWNKIYLRSLFDNIKYDEGHYFEDELIAPFLFYKARRVSFLRVPLYNYVQRPGSIMNTPLTLKKVEDLILMFNQRMHFLYGRNKTLYRLAVQQYKDWLVTVGDLDINNINFQSEYRKYFGIRGNRSFKLWLKDIIGYVDLRLLYRMSKVKSGIKKFFR